MDIKRLENHPTAWRLLYRAMQEAGVKFQHRRGNGRWDTQICGFHDKKENYRIELPHQALRDIYKEGQKWRCRHKDRTGWTMCNSTPQWYADNEYELVPRCTAKVVRDCTREEFIASCARDGYVIDGDVTEC